MKYLNYLSLIAIAGSAIFFNSSCKKDEKTKPIATNDAPAFHTGKGIRPLKIVTHGYFGGTQFSYLTGDVSLSSDGNVHWCYGMPSNVGNAELYRKSFKLSNGDSVLETGALVGIAPAALQTEKIKYVPYANKLYSLIGNAAGYYIDGDVHFNLGGEIIGLFHPYDNGILSSAGFSGYNTIGSNAVAQATANLQASGASTTTQQIYTHTVSNSPSAERSRYRLGAFGLSPEAHMVGLFISGDSAVAIDLATGNTLTSIPYSGMQTSADRFSSLGRNVRSVVSADGNQLAAMYMEQLTANAIPTITTLTYNFATQALSVGVPGIIPAALSVNDIYLLDIAEDGSIVFPSYTEPNNNAGLKIIRQKGTIQTVLASDFLDDNKGSVQYLHATAGKVFVGITTPGSTPGKTMNSVAYVLGVVE